MHSSQLVRNFQTVVWQTTSSQQLMGRQSSRGSCCSPQGPAYKVTLTQISNSQISSGQPAMICCQR